MSDAVQTGPWMPDEATREGLGEQLRAAGAGLRQSSVEIQQIIDDLENQQADSPLGRFHARRGAEVQAN